MWCCRRAGRPVSYSADQWLDGCRLVLNNGMHGLEGCLLYAPARARRLCVFFAMTACSVVEINLGLPLLLGLSFFAMSLTSDE